MSVFVKFEHLQGLLNPRMLYSWHKL